MSKHAMLLILALCPALSWGEAPAANTPASVEPFLFPATMPQLAQGIPSAPRAPSLEPALALPSAPVAVPAASPPASLSLKQESIGNELRYVLILGFMCVSSLVIVLYFLKTRQASAKDIVNASGLILIIFGTIILVLVVDTSEQLTAAIGIMGAIAGYLFKSAQDNASDRTQEGTERKPSTG